MKTENRPLSKIKPYKDNPRKITDAAVGRWQNFTGRKAIRESDGRTFDEAKTDGEKAA